jgi:hypothetical protein
MTWKPEEMMYRIYGSCVFKNLPCKINKKICLMDSKYSDLVVQSCDENALGPKFTELLITRGKRPSAFLNDI